MNKERLNNNTTLKSFNGFDSDISSNEEQNPTPKIVQMKSGILFCFKHFFFKLSKKCLMCISKMSILSQFLFFIIPSFLFLLITIITIHYHAFEKVLKFDYYYAIRKEYLNSIASDIDDIHFDIGSSKIKSSYEELQDLMFFKIYFKELISMGFLNETSKIFPNISHNSETFYQDLDFYSKILKMNNIFTISKKDANKYIDKRKDIFSEFAKLYYYILPNLIFEDYNREIYINQSFLIIYEFDKNNNSIKNDYLYFSFPKSINEIRNAKNFEIDNNYIWPMISKEEGTQETKINNSFYKDNWFNKQDYDFRIESNETFNTRLSFAHLNYNYYGKLNKSKIISIQNYQTYNGKNYIFNYIYFINQRKIIEESFDYSTFIIFNETNQMYINETKRYSDNKTYLIFKSNILEMTLSSPLTIYFHYGMLDKNGNFYNNAISFDGFDIEKLFEPLRFYNTNNNFYIDLRLFSSLYLYATLFIKSEFNCSINEKTGINQFNFENKNNITYDLCSNYNYLSYKEFLNETQINCGNIQNSLYYSQKEIPQYKALYNYMNLPYCICLPLYCLKDKENLNKNNMKFADNISLPDRCQNYLKFFDNNIEIKREKIRVEAQEKINFFSNHLKEKLENDYYLFKYKKFSHIKGIYFLIFNYVDNGILKKLFSQLLDNMTIFQFYFFFLISIGYFILFIIAIIFLIRNIKKLSKVIFDFQKSLEHYLYQPNLDENTSEEKIHEIVFNEKHDISKYSNRLENTFNLSENSPLLKKENDIEEDFDIFNNNIINTNGNQLLDDLFKIFYKYYNISIEKLLKKYYRLKKIISYKFKINLMKDKNEIFFLLSILCIYAPNFKLNYYMDYNFYVKSKLNENFLKFTAKNRLAKSQQIFMTQSVLYELLSTENIDDYGLISNLNLKYITNINLKTKKNNCIKKSMFKYDENEDKDNILKNFNMMLINEKNKNSKIVYKVRNRLLDEFEKNFENDDYIKIDKLNSTFDSFIINVYYKYLKKIIFILDPSQQKENIE